MRKVTVGPRMGLASDPHAGLLGQLFPHPPPQGHPAWGSSGTSVFAPASGWQGLVLVPKTLRDQAGSLPTPTQQEFGRGPSLEPLPPKHRLVLETAFCYSVVSALVRTPLSPWKQLPSRRQLSGCSLQLAGSTLCPLPHSLSRGGFSRSFISSPAVLSSKAGGIWHAVPA